ncbi:hypothetical protein [Polluticoccus soli]|uniref:hypothetical protein n=1 Tax=Polluticoccus soli TaxID=3034150 RepID=UPI0023E24C02|nr:hypothetical protein [Flavipsychrobacter sp. JY13-12]
MRDRDPNRRERMAKAAKQQKVISKDELEKRIDNINKEKDDNAGIRKQEEHDRQRERDRDDGRSR